MDKVWNPRAWPRPLHQGIPVHEHIKTAEYTITLFCFESKFVDYLISFCVEKSIPVQVLQLSLSVASRYLIKNRKYSEPTQLVLLVSLLLAGKLLGNSDGTCGGVSMNELHQYSNHCFTNRDFYRIEKKIIEELSFDVLGEGVADRQVKAVLSMIGEILAPADCQILCRVAEDVQLVLWTHLYTKSDKERLLCRNQKIKSENLLTAAIVQASLVLCTHCVGRFPATVWMIHVLELKEDELSLYVEDVLKIVLGRDKFQELKI